jgi:hypothetical protein
MNAQQTALVSFSRSLETHIQSMSLAAGKSADDVFKEAGQRLLTGLQSADQTARIAVARVEQFFTLKRNGPAGANP